jgi:phosphate/sulfate permease
MKSILVVSSVLGFIVASLMVYTAWQHNPQEEFRSGKAVNWSHLLSLWLSWFLPVSFLLSIVGVAFRKLRVN